MPPPRFIRTALTVLVGSLLLAAPAWATHPERACAGADEPAPWQSEQAVRAAVACLVNRERRARGLRLVRSHPVLRRVGREHAGDMVRQRYFAHQSSDGRSPLQRLLGGGYGRSRRSLVTSGEVLAWARLDMDTPRVIFDAWMHSLSHRRVLLYPRFRHAGVATVAGLPGAPYSDGTTYAMEFGT